MDHQALKTAIQALDSCQFVGLRQYCRDCYELKKEHAVYNFQTLEYKTVYTCGCSTTQGGPDGSHP